jgi:hypothetical protein
VVRGHHSGAADAAAPTWPAVISALEEIDKLIGAA